MDSTVKARTHSIAKSQFYSLEPTSLLSCPEHQIRIPWETHSGNANIARNFFPFLNLDIISCDNMGEQRLDFVDRKEPSGAESKS